MAKLPPEARMGEVTLAVHDLERSIRYYADKLGFRLISQSGDEARLGGDVPLVRLVEEKLSKPRPRQVSGLYHVAYLLPTRADLGRFLRKIAEDRTPVQGASDHLVSEAIYFGDPDGHGIEVYADRPRHSWRIENGRLHMATLPLDVQSVLREAGSSSYDRMPTGSTVGHVHLNVANVEDASTFYRDTVGMDEMVALYGASFLSAGGYHHHLGLNSWEGIRSPAPPSGTLGLREYEILVPTTEALHDIAKRLSTEVSDITRARDPSGNAFVVRIGK